MTHCFAYGTLMFEDIMREVSGCRLTGISGVLRGYVRRCVKGEQYPGLVADSDGRVRGVVYRNVPSAAWRRLDRFEGEMYTRELVRIELADGATVLAGTYVVRRVFRGRLDLSEWDAQGFLRNGKARFQANYSGYQALGSRCRGKGRRRQS